MIGDRVGLRGHKDIPFFQDGRETVDVYVFGIDQNLAGPKRQDGGIDVHRIGTAALDLMNAITAPRWRRSHSMPDALVTLLRVTNKSRPQRQKSAASKTGSNSVRIYEIGSPFSGTRNSASNSSFVSCGLGAAGQTAPRREKAFWIGR